ncbi:MAG: UV DNA damage repair endonuclease UvsE [Gemmatales bacterium]|nr:UV DNA damage repair endonuclease UvsE [Gemmatales bacterium]MDW7993252.1 UV DNA damage repair endonuclease UvsE [Gemmatales bacterium]
MPQPKQDNSHPHPRIFPLSPTTEPLSASHIRGNIWHAAVVITADGLLWRSASIADWTSDAGIDPNLENSCTMSPCTASPQPLVVGRCRLGLCCMFVGISEVRFRTTTAAALSKLPSAAAWHRLCALVEHNAIMLRRALEYCLRLGIRAFRVLSDLLPLATHEQYHYRLCDLPAQIHEHFREAGRFAQSHGIRLSFHPDQFVLLNSPRPEVVRAAIQDLVMHADLAEVLGADVINIHAGGIYGDKKQALQRLARAIDRLPDQVRQRLTLENDDRFYTVADLLPLCHSLQIPLVYDVHHHRCLPDDLSVEQATELAYATWNREPIFHISSPRSGWRSRDPTQHADFIRPADFPVCWLPLSMTVDVEAKAKEKAVLRLARYFAQRQSSAKEHNTE